MAKTAGQIELEIDDAVWRLDLPARGVWYTARRLLERSQTRSITREGVAAACGFEDAADAKLDGLLGLLLAAGLLARAVGRTGGFASPPLQRIDAARTSSAARVARHRALRNTPEKRYVTPAAGEINGVPQDVYSSGLTTERVLRNADGGRYVTPDGNDPLEDAVPSGLNGNGALRNAGDALHPYKEDKKDIEIKESSSGAPGEMPAGNGNGSDDDLLKSGRDVTQAKEVMRRYPKLIRDDRAKNRKTIVRLIRLARASGWDGATAFVAKAADKGATDLIAYAETIQSNAVADADLKAGRQAKTADGPRQAAPGQWANGKYRK
jgi:hypothetical protein